MPHIKYVKYVINKRLIFAYLCLGMVAILKNSDAVIFSRSGVTINKFGGCLAFPIVGQE